MATSKPKRREPVRPPLRVPDRRVIRAAMLDRLADAELAHGHHLAAERLAWMAVAIREATR